ncbi:MAG: glycoside hydrolase family 44 protein [Caldilineaceae bacterium]
MRIPRVLLLFVVMFCASCGFFGDSSRNEAGADANQINAVPTFTATPLPGAEPNTALANADAGASAQQTSLESATSNAQMLSELLIFDEGLNDSWQDWSWSISTEYASTAQVESGASSLAVTYDQGWGALYLHSNTSLPRDEYDALRFWIHGGDAGGQKVRVVLADENDGFREESVEVTAQAQSWTPVDIPLGKLGNLRLINGIAWQDTTGDAQPTFYLDRIAFVNLDLPPTPTPPPVAGPILKVDRAAERRPINPDIYGINYADEALAQELSLSVRRWGGNATTRYNWQNDTANRASDWFFENIPEENANPEALPNGSAADRFVEQGQRMGTKTLLTVPLIGWTPKEREVNCGFSIAKYGPQPEADPWRPDCGNGVDSSGDVIVNNDPTDTSLAIDPSFVQDWIAHLTGRFGTAANGGVAYYSLDNEPMLWHHTHRDVHPDPVGYDELRDLTYAYGAAVKQADPTAQTTGPALWGWTAFFYSALDQAGDNWLNRTPDRSAHDGLPLVPWYLQQMQAYEEQNGVRILDYLDLHFYPQAQGVALTGAGDAETQARRLRSTRGLWDASYTDESWIDEPVRLIPRMREWVDQYYPGTKLALTEYNWGGLDHMNGALAQADILGIFGREGLDLATLWAALGNNDPFAFAFRMYRNYDGSGSRFGDISVHAESSDQDQLAIYASERSADGALTIMIINKSQTPFATSIMIANAGATDNIQVFRYTFEHQEAILPDAALSINNGEIQTVFPGSSITLLVVPAS